MKWAIKWRGRQKLDSTAMVIHKCMYLTKCVFPRTQQVCLVTRNVAITIFTLLTSLPTYYLNFKMISLPKPKKTPYSWRAMRCLAGRIQLKTGIGGLGTWMHANDIRLLSDDKRLRIKIKGMKTITFCETCTRAKQKRNPFKPSIRSMKPGVKFFMDLAGGGKTAKP